MQPCEAGTQAHWWVIDTPNGTVLVRGVCKRCHAERMFPASGDDERTHWKPHIPGLGRSEVRYVYD